MAKKVTREACASADSARVNLMPTDRPQPKSMDEIARALVLIESQLHHFHHSSPWALGVAKVLEPLRACLTHGKIWRVGDPWGRSREQVLERVAHILRDETGIAPSRSRYAKGGLPGAMLWMVEGG